LTGGDPLTNIRLLESLRQRHDKAGFDARAYREADMTDQKNDPEQPEERERSSSDLSRRDFVAMGVAASIAAAAGSASAADLPVDEKNVTIKTPDGNADALFVYPKTGSHPGVIIWPDAFGLRPSMRDIGRRIAAEGYSVLIPNPFYRVAKAPVFEDASHFDFNNPTDRGKLTPLMGSIQAAGAAEKDATAYVAWLDQQSQVDKAHKIGTQGYCMGGALVVRTAAAVPGRIGAGASFHGGGLVTDMPNSPHLLAPKIKARMYFGIASNDDKQQPDAKDKLKSAFAAANVPAEIEVYQSAQHGWCVKDMPNNIYSQPDAERAWGKLEALYKTL
jgi:carboxymethylenebutenolidase